MPMLDFSIHFRIFSSSRLKLQMLAKARSNRQSWLRSISKAVPKNERLSTGPGEKMLNYVEFGEFLCGPEFRPGDGFPQALWHPPEGWNRLLQTPQMGRPAKAQSMGPWADTQIQCGFTNKQPMLFDVGASDIHVYSSIQWHMLIHLHINLVDILAGNIYDRNSCTTWNLLALLFKWHSVQWSHDSLPTAHFFDKHLVLPPFPCIVLQAP